MAVNVESLTGSLWVASSLHFLPCSPYPADDKSSPQVYFPKNPTRLSKEPALFLRSTDTIFWLEVSKWHVPAAWTQTHTHCFLSFRNQSNDDAPNCSVVSPVLTTGSRLLLVTTKSRKIRNRPSTFIWCSWPLLSVLTQFSSSVWTVLTNQRLWNHVTA